MAGDYTTNGDADERGEIGETDCVGAEVVGCVTEDERLRAADDIVPGEDASDEETAEEHAGKFEEQLEWHDDHLEGDLLARVVVAPEFEFLGVGSGRAGRHWRRVLGDGRG